MPVKLGPTQVAFNAPGDGKFTLPFAEQISFFRQKLDVPTAKWDDIIHEAHNKAFMVAGAAKADLLADFHNIVQKSIEEGKSIQWFRANFNDIVKKHGWEGYTGHETQETRDWRTRVIYQTNLSTSYSAGRYAQLTDPDLLQLRPNWEYLHSDAVIHPRPLHVEWSGTVLPADDEWWHTHFAPNGFGCHCRITAVAADRYDGKPAPNNGTYIYKDKTGKEHELPKGVDYGFGYTPGKSATANLKPWIDNKLATLPPQIAKDLKADIVKIPARKTTPEFIPQKTAKAASQWAIDNNLVDHANYGSIHPEVANAMNKSLFDHLAEFPALRTNQKYIGTAQLQFTRWYDITAKPYIDALVGKGFPLEAAQAHIKTRIKKPKVKGNTWMHSWSQPDVTGIAVNDKWGKNLPGFEQTLKECVLSAWHPIGCDTVKSVVDHELGHQLDDLLLLSKKHIIITLYAQAQQAGLKDVLSAYAAKNIKEFIAEAWAESLNNPSPRYYAQQIARIIRDEYTKNHPI